MTTPGVQPLDCEDVVRDVWDWLDNELDQDRWAAIEAHLAGCTGCSEHVEFARSFLNHVRAGGSADVTALRARVQSAMNLLRAN